VQHLSQRNARDDPAALPVSDHHRRHPPMQRHDRAVPHGYLSRSRERHPGNRQPGRGRV